VGQTSRGGNGGVHSRGDLRGVDDSYVVGHEQLGEGECEKRRGKENKIKGTRTENGTVTVCVNR
jgi:hypothetical protein